MSAHLSVEVKPPVPGLDPHASDCVELLRAEEALKSLAEELNVWPLTAYYGDDRTSREDLRDQGPQTPLPEEAHWFDPTRGLDTMRALRDRLGRLAEGMDIHVEQAQAELSGLENVLAAAETQHGRFRLYHRS